MKINSCRVDFGKALTTKQQKGFSDAVKKSKKELGINQGLSLLKIDAAALPRESSKDTGVGKLYSSEAAQFLRTMKIYTDCNAVKDFPQGQMTKQRQGYFGAYNRGALSLGDDKINLFALTKESYGSLLKKSDIIPFVNSNNDNPRLINYQNEIGLSDMNESPLAKGSLPDYYYNAHTAQEKKSVLSQYKASEQRKKGPLYIAYENFKKLDKNHPIKKEYEEFYTSNRSVDYDDIYTRLAIAPFIKTGAIPFVNSSPIGSNEIWAKGDRKSVV